MLSETLQRPDPGETEEDVLALQEEFFKSGNFPSATLVKLNGDEKTYVGCKGTKFKKSYYKVHKEAHCRVKQERILSNLVVEDGPGGGQNICCSVATDVKERDIVTMPRYLPGLTKFAKDGFPSTPVVQKECLLTHEGDTSQSKKSIFALMFEKAAPERFGIKENSLLQKEKTDFAVATDSFDPSVNSYDKIVRLQASSLLTGDGLVCGGLSKAQAANEVKKIHADNLHLLASLSQEEILEEQTRLKELLGSKVSVFNKKSKSCEEVKERNKVKMDDECS